MSSGDKRHRKLASDMIDAGFPTGESDTRDQASLGSRTPIVAASDSGYRH